jgi:anaerobic selenocysteine-containing dehydrogenase
MTHTSASVCPLDCADTCSFTVTVEDEHIVKVRGSRVNPLTRGAICAKVSHYPEFVHSPDRLRTHWPQGCRTVHPHHMGGSP